MAAPSKGREDTYTTTTTIVDEGGRDTSARAVDKQWRFIFPSKLKWFILDWIPSKSSCMSSYHSNQIKSNQILFATSSQHT